MCIETTLCCLRALLLRPSQWSRSGHLFTLFLFLTFMLPNLEADAEQKTENRADNRYGDASNAGCGESGA